MSECYNVKWTKCNKIRYQDNIMKYQQVLWEYTKEVDLLNNILSLGLMRICGHTAAQKKKKNHSFNVYFLSTTQQAL